MTSEELVRALQPTLLSARNRSLEPITLSRKKTAQPSNRYTNISSLEELSRPEKTSYQKAK